MEQLDTRQRARRLLVGLAACQAEFELMCVAVTCGGRRIASSQGLHGLYRDHVALRPRSGSQFVQLIVAQRDAVRALGQLREGSGRAAVADLREVRQRHAAVIDGLMTEVRQLAS
ncbi:MAG TPA: hypothetical protein VFE82_05525 [Ramlibacter sp.]|uniref:hypothetical protein n=1 Tax=Ramlibacter sp. TaxID=1917967 RepID=UPI002D406D21|nr:hypothetical protein [Ramlibacter sp.]HZY17921.1 hypothetical protein [Ramlibacter sp.]